MKIEDLRLELIQHSRGAHALALQILGNNDDAADAVQDALIKAMSAPDAYDEKKGKLKPWFLRVVRNRCFDLLRRRRPNSMAVEELADTAANPEQAAGISQRDFALQQALAAIASEQRQIIVLRDYMDLSYAEIADVLDIKQGTVMSRLHRARLALKEAFNGEHD